MRQSRMFRVSIWTAVAVIAAAGGSAVLWKWVNRSPFILIIEPKGGGGVVQFIQPESSSGGELRSPRFEIAGPVSKALRIVLTSRKVEVPGAVVEHGDTTITPGAFRLRFGDRVFEVMEARIIVDSISHDWIPAPA